MGEAFRSLREIITKQKNFVTIWAKLGLYLMKAMIGMFMVSALSQIILKKSQKTILRPAAPFNLTGEKNVTPYTGNEREVSFIKGSYYEAKKINDEMGEGWAIFDEGDDWYRYGVRFVSENFEEVKEEDFKTYRAV